MKNRFCWMQLQTTGSKKAVDFYSHLFEWEMNQNDEPDHSYIEIDAGEGPVGGIIEVPEQGSGWLPFVQVEDIKASTKKAQFLGAEVLVDSQEISNGGLYSVIVDPTGAPVGLYQPPQQ